MRAENQWYYALKNLIGKRPNMEDINFEYGYFTLFQFLSIR